MSTTAADAVNHLLAALQLMQHELLLFAAFWFILGAVDELAVDLIWIWLRITGRVRDRRLVSSDEVRALRGPAAVFVPAWQEAEVIGAMVSHTLRAWPQRALTLYIGCYGNDPRTIGAAMAAAGKDGRIRVVIHDRSGPTTKADCLNRLYAALLTDEKRRGQRFSSIILHDAEDMVHPAALSIIDDALSEVEFVQLPVRPEPQPASRWVGGHYSDEFTEAHMKSLVVRDALGAAIPAAGVGCGFSREALAQLAHLRLAEGADGPFASECLTEDYELGMLVSRSGARSRFVRARDAFGNLVATRAFFPADLESAVRQKARWIHGIALQGWDRLGWSARPVEVWMALRDRHGPLTALVLASAYGLLGIELVLQLARMAGWQDAVGLSPLLKMMLAISFASFVWRALWRFSFTSREYGFGEGICALLRIPVANVVSIMAGGRALVAYVRTLSGGDVTWDKTRHSHHPAHSEQALSS